MTWAGPDELAERALIEVSRLQREALERVRVAEVEAARWGRFTSQEGEMTVEGKR